MEVIAAGGGIEGVDAVGVAVTGLIKALRRRATAAATARLGHGGQAGARHLALEHRGLDTGQEVRGGRQHSVRLAVAVGVDPDVGRVLRRGDVRLDRGAAGAELDAAGQLAPGALLPLDRREYDLDIEGQRRRIGAAQGLVRTIFIVVVGCSPARVTATSYLPQLVSIGCVLTSESAISWESVTGATVEHPTWRRASPGSGDTRTLSAA